MAVTTFHPLLLLLLHLLVVTANGTSKPVKYQTLVVNPLRSPPPLLPDYDIAIETMATADEAEVTLPVPSPVRVHLTNRDSLLAASATAEQIFALRLDRDAARVETIRHTLAAAKAAEVTGRRGFMTQLVSGLTLGIGAYFTRIGISCEVRLHGA